MCTDDRSKLSTCRESLNLWQCAIYSGSDYQGQVTGHALSLNQPSDLLTAGQPRVGLACTSSRARPRQLASTWDVMVLPERPKVRCVDFISAICRQASSGPHRRIWRILREDVVFRTYTTLPRFFSIGWGVSILSGNKFSLAPVSVWGQAQLAKDYLGRSMGMIVGAI